MKAQLQKELKKMIYEKGKVPCAFTMIIITAATVLTCMSRNFSSAGNKAFRD